MRKRIKSEKVKKHFKNGRFLVFTVLLAAAFTYMVYGAWKLQIRDGATYAAQADVLSSKTIPVKGMRGMITDVNSVILAKSETTYNVTFQRTNSENNYRDYSQFTTSILDTLEILKKYGVELSVETPLFFNEETGLWDLNFGEGVSEEVLEKRQRMWRSNHYLSSSKYDDPEQMFIRLCQRYALADSYDENGNIKHKAVAVVDRNTALQVMAVYNEMQMNLFNSLPVVIAEDVPFSAVSEIEGRSMSLRGMGIQVGEKRVYPHGSLASSVIGYTGAIQNSQRYYDELKPQGYAMSDHMGLDGVEQTMESWLTACISERQGSRIVEKDSSGKITRELEYIEPHDGNTVKLSMDVNMQQAAQRAIEDNVNLVRDLQETKMQEGKWLEVNREKIDKRDWEKYPIELAETGVLLVMDLETGKILADGQYPVYDLNIMIEGGKKAQEVILDDRGLQRNYAVQQSAEPGSIFKMVTGLAALTNYETTGFTVNSRISDGGKFMVYTSNAAEAPTCWTKYPHRHKDQTIVEGLTNSCNYFFYQLGSMLYGAKGEHAGEQLLYKYAAEMGLTSKTGIELPGEVRSYVGNQQNLYDPTVSLDEQVTTVPILVASQIKKHLTNFGATYGIEYDEARLDRAAKQLMDMAINSGSDYWVENARPILMNELNMTREMVMKRALMSDLWVYLNDIKWGGSQEIQVAIGQSITQITPAAAVRYVGSLAEGNVWNLSIIDSIISPDGEVLSHQEPSLFNYLDSAIEFLPKIKEGMTGVVDEGGTATRYLKNWKYKATDWMMGKTGTSQVTRGGVKIDLENNAWFVCLAPKDRPKIAIVSYIRNGYAGAHCVPGARDFLTWYLDDLTKVEENIVLPGGNQLAP